MGIVAFNNTKLFPSQQWGEGMMNKYSNFIQNYSEIPAIDSGLSFP